MQASTSATDPMVEETDKPAIGTVGYRRQIDCSESDKDRCCIPEILAKVGWSEEVHIWGGVHISSMNSEINFGITWTLLLVGGVWLD